MKKRLRSGLIVLVMALAILPLSSCKLMQGEYFINYINSIASRNLVQSLSYLYVETSVYSNNQVSGKITDWYVKLYTADDELIQEITMDDYENLGLNLKVTRTPITGFYPGSLVLITDPACPGDMFKGMVPAKVLVRVYLEDMNGYQTEAAYIAGVSFSEVTE